MKYICLGCGELVEKNINENYNGMAIHFGFDWYCGPVVTVMDSVANETIKHVKEAVSEKSYNEDRIAALEARLEEAREVVKPFAHDDLCKRLSNNGINEESVIFGRDNAELKLGDFRRAAAWLREASA